MKALRSLALLLAFFGVCAFADVNTSALTRLQSRWAEVNYEMTGDAQKKAYEQLLDEAATFLQQHPNDAELLIWSGIIKSSFAGIKGGFGGLKYAKQAKADFEAALTTEPSALGGSAYTSLGVLYFKVPGWPIGFGDNKKADELLRKALVINAGGIDPNYFYGEYLRSEKRYAEAEVYYRKALAAPSRTGRELADRGRHQEIESALAAIAAKGH